jgi:release factor glutamine methyltransferase
VDTPVLDARMLLEAGAGVTRTEIVTDPYRVLGAAQIAQVRDLIERRIAGEPVAYIVGKKAFWKHEFEVTADTLIPRPETEFVVDAALRLLIDARAARVLDLGAGTGAILLSVLAERLDASGVGIDASAAALAVARGNAQALGLSARVQFREGDWGRGEQGPFDLVLSNPPYIASGDIAGLAPEVRCEPRLALDGGDDGLDAYRRIISDLPRLMAPGAGFALEVGAGQAEQVAELARSAGLLVNAPLADLANVPRVVWGRAPG